MFMTPMEDTAHQWPNGASGNVTIAADTYWDCSASTANFDVANLTINTGTTLYLMVTDGTPCALGVAGNLTLNGNIRCISKDFGINWTASQFKERITTLNNTISWTTPAARTGGNGGAGGANYGEYAPGGTASSAGLGWGAGGGGGSCQAYGDNPPGSGGNTFADGVAGWHWTSGGATQINAGGTSSTNIGNGVNSVAGGRRLTATGHTPNLVTGAGGGGGSASVFNFGQTSYGGAGGSGGIPGAHGACLLVIVLGSISGSGTISVSATAATSYSGGNSGGPQGGAGGGGGGGGAGGSGGKLTVKHNTGSTPAATLTAAATTGASGGAAGITTFGDPAASGSPGGNGTAGTTSIAVL